MLHVPNPCQRLPRLQGDTLHVSAAPPCPRRARGKIWASAARSASLLLHVCTEPNTSGDGDKGCAATKQRVPSFSEADKQIYVKNMK